MEPAGAALSIDDPAVRWGEGLLETMRAEGGRVALLERHLERLMRSARELGLTRMATARGHAGGRGARRSRPRAPARGASACAPPRDRPCWWR